MKSVHLTLFLSVFYKPFKLDICLLTQITRTAILDSPNFCMKSWIIALEKLLMKFYPNTKIVIAQPSFFICIHINSMLQKHFLCKLLNQCIHVAIFNFKLELLFIDFKKSTLILDFEKVIIRLIKSCVRLFSWTVHLELNDIIIRVVAF